MPLEINERGFLDALRGRFAQANKTLATLPMCTWTNPSAAYCRPNS